MNSENNIIRQKIKSERDLMSSDLAERLSGCVFRRLLSLGVIEKNQSFLVYKSFRNEVDTKKLIAYLESLNKTVAYPMTVGDEMISVVAKGSDFVKGDFGIEAPKEYKIIENPDVVFVPLVACDLNKNRLGFGRGFFDRYLKDKKCLKIGLCYEFQIVDEIVPNEWDIPLDFIVSEKRVL